MIGETYVGSAGTGIGAAASVGTTGRRWFMSGSGVTAVLAIAGA